MKDLKTYSADRVGCEWTRADHDLLVKVLVQIDRLAVQLHETASEYGRVLTESAEAKANRMAVLCEAKIQQHCAVVEELRDVQNKLSDAKKDTERLDWMQSNIDTEKQRTNNGNVTQTIYLYRNESVRQAIDEARKIDRLVVFGYLPRQRHG